jgi:FkbM family methyltransferase
MTRETLRTIFRYLSRLTANPLCQYLLDEAVIAGQFMQGIGGGVNPEISGERAVFDRIMKSTGREGRGDVPLCVFDVGANVGQFLHMALDCLRNRKVEVHCFEPGVKAFGLLCDAVANRPGVFVNQFALGKAAGRMELFYDAEASDLASFTRQKLAHRGIEMNQSEMVEVQTVDQYCLAKGIRRIDLLKIDVEGHDSTYCRAPARCSANPPSNL